MQSLADLRTTSNYRSGHVTKPPVTQHVSVPFLQSLRRDFEKSLSKSTEKSTF